MTSRLLVRFRTTVSSNTRGHRDQLLQAALLAQGFAMTGGQSTTPPSLTTSGRSAPPATRHAGAGNTPSARTTRLGNAADNPAAATARSTTRLPLAAQALARIVGTTRQAWRQERRNDVQGNTDITTPIRPADTPTWSAFSHDIDGQDIKALLRRQGFADHEFRIHMEFQRGWGCL